MAARIARHQAERGRRWRTIEAPLDLAGALAQVGPQETAVIDCLTLWVSNLMHADLDVAAETDRLLAALAGRDALLVANEVGLGIVPDNALARRFRDEAGRLNQRMAAAADRVVFVAAGLPLWMKGGPGVEAPLIPEPVTPSASRSPQTRRPGPPGRPPAPDRR